MLIKKINYIIMACVLVIGVALGACIMCLPSSSADTSGFSAENAAGYLEVISQKPHSVFDEENHEEVRQYLLTTLRDMGYEVEEHNWTPEEHGFSDNLSPEGLLDEDRPVEYDVKNLWVKIPGKSDTGMLIMAHYDSRGHATRTGEIPGSYGAADDGYGVSVLLEIARLYKDVPQSALENSIYLCFADAEETGMYGSKLEAMHNETLKNNVNFVMNVEARGVKGPVYMFETSTNNRNVIRLYKNADMPFAYSLATAVYTVMPNFTDFTSMLEIGKAGINFAVLDNLYYYHTPEDNFSNINKNSLQHYGSQIMPIIKEYTTNAAYSDMDYFEAGEDSVFFNILPTVMAVYTETAGIVFAVLAALLFAAAALFLVKKGKIRLKHTLIAVGVIFAAMLGAAAFGFVLSYLVALIGGVPWKLTYIRVPLSGIPFALSLIVVLGLLLWFAIRKNGKNSFFKWEYLTAGAFISLLLALITTFALVGASFLFLWPAVLASIVMLVNAFTGNYYIGHALMSLCSLVILLLNVPILYSLLLAVTTGGLLAVNLLFVVALAIMIPVALAQKDLTIKKAAE